MYSYGDVKFLTQVKYSQEILFGGSKITILCKMNRLKVSYLLKE